MFVVFSRDNTQSREEALSVFRSNAEFVRYVVSVAVQKIQQLEETGQTDGPDGQNTEKMFHILCKMTRWESLWVVLQVWSDHVKADGHLWCLFPSSVFMWHYTNIPSVVEDAGKKEKRSSLSLLCLEGLLKIFTTCQQRFPQRMTQLLSNTGWFHTYFFLWSCRFSYRWTVVKLTVSRNYCIPCRCPWDQ